MGAPRSNAAAKDSEWVRQRGQLEAARGADTEEVLLASHSEHNEHAQRGQGASESAGPQLLEGTQTNFFAVDAHGTVHTAPEGAVLGGTVRRLVLEVCSREGIPVSLTPPTLGAAGSWSGCFLTSTSRLVLPVDEVTYDPAVMMHMGAQARTSAQAEKAGGVELVRVRVPSASCGVVTRLERLVAAEVAAHSTRLEL